jgi:NADH dehydrogenase
MLKFDVVIAGGGFAGAYCARALAKALDRVEGERRVALIAETNILVFQPMLAEVAGSSLSPGDVVNPLRLFCRGVTVLQGSIQHIDLAAKTLVMDGGVFTRNHEVGFDHLALALGSVTNLHAIPGMSDNGVPMKNVADALRLRATVINRLEEANLTDDETTRVQLLTFVVVGGGYTGVETAGQVIDLIRQVRPFYTHLTAAPVRVVLVHSRDALLGDIGPELGHYAQRVLVKNGVEVRLNTKVAAVTARKVLLDDGTAIDAHTCITTIGNAPNPVLLDVCRQLGIDPPKGRIPTEANLRVKGQERLWAVGDGAAVPWNDRGKEKVSPQTAQFALRQGRLLGENLAAVLQGRPPRPFVYRYLGQLAAIGERQAVAEMFGFHFTGLFAWLMWRTIYLAKLPGLLRKLRVLIDWNFDLIFPRDISLLVPPPDEALRPFHLERGEALFERGHVCLAFAYVHRGSLLVAAPGQPDRTMAAGAVIDEAELDEHGHWAASATATEPTDVMLFRGRALELLRKDLRLVHR